METIVTAKVTYIVCQKDNWCALTVENEDFGSFKVSGVLASNVKLKKSKSLSFTGSWVNDQKFGKTFKCSLIDLPKENSLESILTEAGLSKKLAKEVVSKFDLVLTLNERPAELLLVEGITTGKLNKIIAVWESRKAFDELSDFLAKVGCDVVLINKIYKHFGREAYEIIKSNPYKLIFVPGCKLKVAVDLIKQIGEDQAQLQSVCATTVAAFNIRANDNGDTAIGRKLLISLAMDIDIRIEDFLIESAIDKLISEGDVIELGEKSLSLVTYYDREAGIVKFLEMRKNFRTTKALTENQLDAVIDVQGWEMQVEFSAKQRRAIQLSATGANTIAICGYAGTGKTTVAKALLELHTGQAKMEKKELPKIICLALSGVAADRCFQSTGYPARTIHAALGWTPAEEGEEGSFKYNSRNKLPYDVILIDECSMINSHLFYCLLDAIKPTTKLILMGDDAQLPPIGAADVFRDILISGLVPVVQLDEVFRQSKDSAIAIFAEAIRKGLVPEGYLDAWKDFEFVEKNRSEETFSTIIERAEAAKPGVIDKIRGFQVLSPFKVGPLGANKLNLELQHIFNPIQQYRMTVGDAVYRVDDKVIHTKNVRMECVKEELDEECDAGVEDEDGVESSKTVMICNGFIGVVTNLEKGKLTVEYPSNAGSIQVIYTTGQIKAFLEHAYALSVHKYQGAEAGHIVIPISAMHTRMLNNRWMYTAITRAKSLCVLVGQKDVFERACTTLDEAKRETIIPRLLSIESQTKGA